MTGTAHLKQMVLGGAGIFGVLLLFGLPLQSAFFLAVALACPLMMVFMMGGHSSHDAESRTGRDEPSSDRPDRTSSTHRPH